MKIFKHRNIMGLIYGVILAIPMLSILVRSAYVVVNKNAFESYSGTTQVNETTEYPTNIYNGRTYYFVKNVNVAMNNLAITPAIIKNEYSSRSDMDLYIHENINNIGAIELRHLPNDTTQIYFYDTNLDYMDYYSIYIDTMFNMEFVCQSNTQYENTNETLLTYEYNNNAYLDNAFDYSLSEYVTENSFGNLNFFEWWSNLFLDLNNPKSALYIHFVNWYMNYVLFVSSSYILFMVLMWFINYSRRLMERGLNYDW